MMIRVAQWIILIGVGFSAVSCVYLRVGDGALRLRGQVVASDRPAKNCTLELRMERTNEIIAIQSIEDSFLLDFVVDPRSRSYYVHVWCQGYGATYDSPAFKSRGLKTYYQPVDLGIISIPPTLPEG